MVLAAYVATGFSVAGLYAWGLLRGRNDAYHRAGIPEYWIIDARGEEIDFHILHRRKSGYASAPARGGWQRSRVFGRSFRLDRKLDEFGLWEYTLHVKDD